MEMIELQIPEMLEIEPEMLYLQRDGYVNNGRRDRGGRRERPL